MPTAYDYNLTLLLLLQPVFPPTGTFGESLAAALGVVAAPVVALAAYLALFPTNAGRRMARLRALMLTELEDLAAAPRAAEHAAAWRARLYHRLLRLDRLHDRSGERSLSILEEGLKILSLGDAILDLHALSGRETLTDGARRAIRAALGRLRRVTAEPLAAERALGRAALRLRSEAAEASEVAEAAARMIGAAAERRLRASSPP